MENKRPIFVASIDTQEIARRLRLTTIGELVTYAELDKLINRSSRRHGLFTARRELLNECIVFAAVANEGVRRLPDEEIVQTGRSVIRKVNRASKRGMRVLSTVNYDQLATPMQLLHNASMTVLALTAATSGADSVRKIEAGVKDSSAALPAARAALIAFPSIK